MAIEFMGRYPVGMQTFADIRRRGMLYIDKTAYVWRLAHEAGKAFFLSRPRRFGKSLLISTMQSYFEGRRELFGGLAVEDLETVWETYPVIRIDMSTVKPTDVEGPKSRLSSLLGSIERRFGLERCDEMPGARLQSIIERVAEASGKQVVVLVDEYDAPLLNVVDDSVQLERFRQVMREFFIPLKACDEFLRFVFLTGITKFSQLSIFSELNNLRNISMEPAFAAVCGITDDELHGKMASDVANLAARLGITVGEAFARLRDHYDGYHFSWPSPDIYNPFSLLSAFAKGDIGSWWFETGTPSSLVRLVAANGWDIADMEEREALESGFDVPTESMDTPLPMLYQGGYLTIKSYDAESRVYTLGIPNVEVSRGLSEGLVAAAGPGALDRHSTFLIKLARSFRTDEIEAALEQIRVYLAGIPYHLGSRDERGFQTKFYLILDLLGIQIDTEFKTASGRVDAVVRTGTSIYVMEFKYGKTAAEALAQIDAKDYALPFASDDNRRVVKVGVSFSPKEQTIDSWIIEEDRS